MRVPRYSPRPATQVLPRSQRLPVFPYPFDTARRPSLATPHAPRVTWMTPVSRTPGSRAAAVWTIHSARPGRTGAARRSCPALERTTFARTTPASSTATVRASPFASAGRPWEAVGPQTRACRATAASTPTAAQAATARPPTAAAGPGGASRGTTATRPPTTARTTATAPNWVTGAAGNPTTPSGRAPLARAADERPAVPAPHCRVTSQSASSHALCTPTTRWPRRPTARSCRGNGHPRAIARPVTPMTSVETMG